MQLPVSEVMKTCKFIKICIWNMWFQTFFYESCMSKGWVGLSGFNIRLEQRQWAIADGLGFILKDDPETCHHNFDLPRRGWLLRFEIPRSIIRMGTWRTLNPRRILPASGAITILLSNVISTKNCPLLQTLLLMSNLFLTIFQFKGRWIARKRGYVNSITLLLKLRKFSF